MQKTAIFGFLAILAFLFAPAMSLAQNCPAASPTNRTIPTGATAANFSIPKLRSQIISPSTTNPLVLVSSHRGNWEFCPENTLESFHSAWDYGAAAIEMDVRVSAPGQDSNIPMPVSNGMNFLNGEIFLTHDYDLRGEAIDSTALQQSNNVYQLTPTQLRARQMVDRHGKLVKDSSGTGLVMHSFIDLLNSYYQRAFSLGNDAVIAAGTSPGAGGSTVPN
jgi:hypothetical protein